jgi:hypothetical protein
VQLLHSDETADTAYTIEESRGTMRTARNMLRSDETTSSKREKEWKKKEKWSATCSP